MKVALDLMMGLFHEQYDSHFIVYMGGHLENREVKMIGSLILVKECQQLPVI